MRRHRWKFVQAPYFEGPECRVFQCQDESCLITVHGRWDLGPHMAHRERWVFADGTERVFKAGERRPPCPCKSAQDLAPPDRTPVRKSAVRKRTIDRRAPLADADPLEPDIVSLMAARPRQRSQCRGGQRPCPYVSCRFHLYLDVTRDGNLRVNRDDLEPWEMADTCALDVADRGRIELERIGEMLGLTRERVRQVEAKGLMELRMSIDGDADLEEAFRA